MNIIFYWVSLPSRVNQSSLFVSWDSVLPAPPPPPKKKNKNAPALHCSVKLLRCWAVKLRISSRRCSGLRIVRTSIQSTMRRLQECIYRSRIRDVNDLMERLIDEGATSTQLWSLHHHLCGSESVAYSSASLRACWWRAVFEHQL